MVKKKTAKKAKKKSSKRKSVKKKSSTKPQGDGVHDGRSYKVRHESLFTVYIYPDDGEILAGILEDLQFDDGDVNVAVVNKSMNNDDNPEDMYRATFRVDPLKEREVREKIELGIVTETENYDGTWTKTPGFPNMSSGDATMTNGTWVTDNTNPHYGYPRSGDLVGVVTDATSDTTTATIQIGGNIVCGSDREIGISGINVKTDGRKAEFDDTAYLKATKADVLQFKVHGNPALMWRKCKDPQDIVGSGCFWREYTDGTELPKYVQFAAPELKRITKVFTQKTKFSNVYLDGKHITIQLD